MLQHLVLLGSDKIVAIDIEWLSIRQKQTIVIMILLSSHKSSEKKPSQLMRAVGREPAEGGIPVELISYQSLGHREKF